MPFRVSTFIICHLTMGMEFFDLLSRVTLRKWGFLDFLRYSLPFHFKFSSNIVVSISRLAKLFNNITIQNNIASKWRKTQITALLKTGNDRSPASFKLPTNTYRFTRNEFKNQLKTTYPTVKFSTKWPDSVTSASIGRCLACYWKRCALWRFTHNITGDCNKYFLIHSNFNLQQLLFSDFIQWLGQYYSTIYPDGRFQCPFNIIEYCAIQCKGSH